MVPIVASLIMQGIGQNQQMSAQDAANEAARSSGVNNSIMQKRNDRQVAADQVQPEGRTGLAGMDAMTPATTRQMQIFQNVMNRYQPNQQQQPAGGMQQ